MVIVLFLFLVSETGTSSSIARHLRRSHIPKRYTEIVSQRRHSLPLRNFFHLPSGCSKLRPVLCSGHDQGIREEQRVIEINNNDPVQIGDTVSLEYSIRTESGEELQSSKKTGPMTFKVGVGQTVQNPLFQGIDDQVIGLRIGEAKFLNMTGPSWDPELLFKVPANHPEIERLQRRYSAEGGLREGEYVELVNGATALVMKMTDEEVMLDCNSAFAGNSCSIEFEVMKIEAGDGTQRAYRPPS